ncbi:nuclear transport factor 2 family protein [Pseudoalteromonas sp. SG41-5]|uniref:nuclear transport factor 2 family protein n=1 Tax=Pseudoalteromonas sp. SG41-5 TaxID=2760975 RepID=UPI0016040C1F|nr:nuclear transport factor 2 family protein [Pseudoalteromonas sp. SG41-5]MBB1468468.1 nuclear transport factor 2 family protein [Pseudoalteromonas sp. SG41-5]
MKPLFFLVSLLLAWQLLATAAEVVEPPTKTETKAAELPAAVKTTDTSAGEEKSVQSKAPAKSTEVELQDSPAVITLTPQNEQSAEPVNVEPTQPIKTDTSKPSEPEVDTSKVLGTEAAKPAELPKTQQEKQLAVAQAEQAVIQAKEALTLKQQVKAKQSRESLAVIEQLIMAYNARNIDAFISMYDENVEFYAFPNELLFKGKEKLIARYGIMFKKLKCIKSSPIKRIVHGNIVIDHELSETCSTDPNVVDKRGELISSYQVENGKITKVLFFR